MSSDALGRISQLASNSCYGGLALVALWGIYCAIAVWRRTAQLRFKNEAEQTAYLRRLEAYLEADDFAAAAALCRDDERAVPQLALLALDNVEQGYTRLRHLVSDMFEREVLAQLQYSVSWIQTVIKTAPMLGLFGTVLGMMAAFGKLSSGDKVEPTALSSDISLALITTALGLAIAIPLTICLASINIQIRKFEDLAARGLTRFFDSLRSVMQRGA